MSVVGGPSARGLAFVNFKFRFKKLILGSNFEVGVDMAGP